MTPGVAASQRVSYDRRFRQAAVALGGLVAVVGVCAVIGLVWDIPVLYRLRPELPGIKFNAALLFCGLGALLIWTSSRFTQRRGRRALAWVLAGFAGLTLAQWVLRVDLGIDELFMNDPVDFYPGRMAPSAALNFLLLGLGLSWIDTKSAKRSQTIALFVAAICLVPLCGYLYGAVSLLTVGARTAIALPATFAFMAAAASVLFARPEVGMMQVIGADTRAARLIRRLLPAMLLIPLLVGWLRMKGQEAGWYGTAFGEAIVISCNAMLLSGLTWKLVGSLHGSELELMRGMKALHDNEQALSVTLNSMTDGLIATDTLGRIVRINASAERLTGWKDTQALHKPLHEVLHLFDETNGEALSSPVEAVLSADRTVRIADPATLAMRDGGLLPVTGSAAPIREPHGGVRGVAVVFHDASIERAAERLAADKSRQALRARDEQLRFVVDGVRDHGIFMVDPNGIIVTWSKGAERMLGFDDAGAIGQSVALFGDGSEHHKEHMVQMLAEAAAKGRYEAEGVRYRQDRSQFWAALTITALRDGNDALIGYAVVIQDFTERRKVEEDLRQRQAHLSAALQEREILLQEVHHRVKNNLQVISSLVNMQARTVQDTHSREALDQCKARIESIARIHEQLYQSQNYARIPFSEYAKSLTHNIFDAMGVSQSRIHLNLDIDDVEQASLPVDQAIPCGLILNELVTNALKHAFPDRRSGNIGIALHRHDTHMQFTVSDDGVGMVGAPDPRQSKSLGMLLTATLVEQLEGTLEITGAPGTRFSITFPAGVHA